MADAMVPPMLIRLDDEMNVLQLGERLQITASVDLDGLCRLRALLDKYSEILEIVGRPPRTMVAADIETERPAEPAPAKAGGNAER